MIQHVYVSDAFGALVSSMRPDGGAQTKLLGNKVPRVPFPTPGCQDATIFLGAAGHWTFVYTTTVQARRQLLRKHILADHQRSHLLLSSPASASTQTSLTH